MKAFYASEWRSGDVMKPVRNPFDESTIEEAPDYSPEVLDAALNGLSMGTADLRDLGREDHHAVFVRLHKIMLRDRMRLTRQIQIEQGKPLYEAVAEVQGAIQSVETLALDPCLIGPEFQPLATEPASRGGLGFTVRQPHGIVGILTPVVFPFLFPTIHVCYALAAGNSVLLKPARTTPIIALRLVQMLLEAGLPQTAIACLPGSGKTLGAAICGDSRLNHLSCLGRIPTVQSIRHVSAFVPTQLQWGCVSSVIVDRTADLDRLIKSFVHASFDNAGQSAFTTSWIAAEDEVHDEVVDRLTAAMEAIRLGDPKDSSTQMGPVTSALSKKTFDEVLEIELQSGAKVVTGGKRERRLIRPTLLRDCNPSQSILAKQEVRGPLVGVSRISKTQDAIDTLQRQRYHILNLFTEKRGAAVKQAMRLPFENVYVNAIPTWRDGLVCVPGHPPRSGLRSSYDRIKDYSRLRDVVCR